MKIKNISKILIYVNNRPVWPEEQIEVDWHLAASGSPVSALIKKGLLEIVKFDGPRDVRRKVMKP